MPSIDLNIEQKTVSATNLLHRGMMYNEQIKEKERVAKLSWGQRMKEQLDAEIETIKWLFENKKQK